MRDALGVGATSDPEKKRAAEARYAQKKDEQFLSVKNYMSRSGQNITADMKKDKMLTTFNADELRLFHDSLTDDEKGRFFPVTESASSSQDVLNLMLAEQQERGLVTGILEKEDAQDQVLLGGKLAEDMVLVDLLEEQRQKVGGPGEDAAIRFAQTIFAMRPDLPERYKGAEGVFRNIDQLSQKVGSLDVDLLRFFHNMGNGEKGRNALLELLMPAQFKSEDYLVINDLLRFPVIDLGPTFRPVCPLFPVKFLAASFCIFRPEAKTLPATSFKNMFSPFLSSLANCFGVNSLTRYFQNCEMDKAFLSLQAESISVKALCFPFFGKLFLFPELFCFVATVKPKHKSHGLNRLVRFLKNNPRRI